MYNQIYPYFKTTFSKLQWGLRKGFNAQHCILLRSEKWREVVGSGGEKGGVLTHLSKALDVNAYVAEKSSHDFIHICLR